MKLSRRDFARAASLAAGAALLPRRAHAQAGEAEPSPSSLPPPAPPKVSQAAQAEVNARIQLVNARWAARLGAQERALVASLCAELQGSLDAVRAVPLDPTDEPATIFRAARQKR